MKFTVIIILLLVACNNNRIENKDVIHYGTDAFYTFENEAPISKERAREISEEYGIQNQIRRGTLFFIIDSCYVFSSYYNLKILELRLSGIYVNAYTGKVTYIYNDHRIRRESDGWPKPFSTHVKDSEK